MKSPWEFFSLEELKCKCGKCGSTGLEMNTIFMSDVIKLRQILNHPVIITSAYRCPKYNSLKSHTGEQGPHTTGCAIDILCCENTAYTILKLAMEIGFCGIGINQKISTIRFIHLDICDKTKFPRPNIWSY